MADAGGGVSGTAWASILRGKVDTRPEHHPADLKFRLAQRCEACGREHGTDWTMPNDTLHERVAWTFRARRATLVKALERCRAKHPKAGPG